MRGVTVSLRLAGLIALVALVLVAPAQGANSQVYDDAVGDNDGAGTNNFAADIISTRVESSDNGDVTFTVTLRNATGQLQNGDVLEIFVDSDRDQSTGIQGDEFLIEAFGVTGQEPYLQFCNPGQGDWSCQHDTASSHVFTAPETHVFSFTFGTAWSAVQFLVQTEYGDKLDQSGYWEFDLRADTDGDGINGFADKCPTKPGGRFDGNHDGCPGPYKSMPKIGIKYGPWTKTFTSVRYSAFGVTGVPSSAKVKVRAGGATFTRRGSGSIPGLARRNLPAGMTITFTASRDGWCSQVRTIKIKPSSSNGYINIGERLIHPAGIECN